ncbi:MAG TPA: HD domain-containing protein [Chitinophagaceae bacterium]|nr:HD domain-containing protein [Chitinophagaceae bacterium]
MRKIINDPVHGFITIDDELVFSLISHPWFQRLRRIKQMALAYLVYPGAVHTRLHHALGAYHLMSAALTELHLKGTDISIREERASKLAILMHDIGHGPFSHALEHAIVDVHHENLSLLIMQRFISELAKTDEDYQVMHMAVEIFQGTYRKNFLHQLVSSQLDVDRMDYLARDSFFTGVSEGVIGYDRILKMLCVREDELLVEEKGLHSIEKFLIARRLMYDQVYLHKTVLSSELMLLTVLQRARELSLLGEQLFATPALQYFLQHEITLADFQSGEECLQTFLELDDFDIVSAIKVWSRHSDPVLSDLSSRLLGRNLFKVRFMGSSSQNEIDEIRENLIREGVVPDQIRYYLLAGSTASITYQAGQERIKILFKNGEVRDITEAENSLIQDALLIPVKKPYICFLRNQQRS